MIKGMTWSCDTNASPEYLSQCVFQERERLQPMAGLRTPLKWKSSQADPQFSSNWLGFQAFSGQRLWLSHLTDHGLWRTVDKNTGQVRIQTSSILSCRCHFVDSYALETGCCEPYVVCQSLALVKTRSLSVCTQLAKAGVRQHLIFLKQGRAKREQWERVGLNRTDPRKPGHLMEKKMTQRNSKKTRVKKQRRQYEWVSLATGLLNDIPKVCRCECMVLNWTTTEIEEIAVSQKM